MGLFHRHQKPAPPPVAQHVQQPLAPQGGSGLKNVVYFANWSVYQRKHFAIDLPVSHISHVFYAFCHIDPNTGRIKFTDEWCDLQLPLALPKNPEAKVTGSLQQLFQLKQMNRHLKVVLLIGGWATEGQFQGMVRDEGRLNAFVKLCGEWIREYGFDGIDIDWEYPTGPEMAVYVRLLAMVRQELALISPKLTLSIAAPAGDDKLAVLDIESIDRYLDFWNVMCYDYAGLWSSKLGYHLNLFGDNGDNALNTDAVLETYKRRGVAPAKLVMGMPLYGRAFFGSANQVGGPFSQLQRPGLWPFEADVVDYNKLDQVASERACDPRKVAALAYNPQTQALITYDDSQCARIKARYAQLKGLGGGMWWDSAGDHREPEQSLAQTFINELGGPQALDRLENSLDLYQNSKYLAGV